MRRHDAQCRKWCCDAGAKRSGATEPRSSPCTVAHEARSADTAVRSVRIENTPVWMQNVMAKSGLFRDHIIKMAQIVTWFWLGEEGTFTYWPDGPLGEPKRLEHPLWNKGVVVQNEMMFHRGDPVGRPEERDIPGLKHRSLIGYDDSRGDWAITTDGEVIRRYAPDEMRLLVHWSAEIYSDMDEVKKNMDHSDDLTHDVVFERLFADMRARGVQVAEPSDPLHDTAFIRALIATSGQVTPEVERALAEAGDLRRECETAMLKHFVEVSRAMPPEQGRRYLDWICAQTLASAHASMAPAAGSPPAHEHPSN